MRFGISAPVQDAEIINQPATNPQQQQQATGGTATSTTTTTHTAEVKSSEKKVGTYTRGQLITTMLATGAVTFAAGYGVGNAIANRRHARATASADEVGSGAASI